jgi:hypothetical protein
MRIFRSMCVVVVNNETGNGKLVSVSKRAHLYGTQSRASAMLNSYDAVRCH